MLRTVHVSPGRHVVQSSSGWHVVAERVAGLWRVTLVSMRGTARYEHDTKIVSDEELRPTVLSLLRGGRDGEPVEPVAAQPVQSPTVTRTVAALVERLRRP